MKSESIMKKRQIDVEKKKSIKDSKLNLKR